MKNMWGKGPFCSFHSKLDLSSTNRAKQKIFYKNFKIFDQSRIGFDQSKKKDSIDRVPIEDQSNQAEPSLKNLRNFRSVEKHTQLIEILEKLNFWKTAKFLYIKHSNQLISWMKCMSMNLKVFQKHLLSTQNFQKQDYDTICPQISINEHILYQNQRTYNLGWPNQLHTQFHVLSLAKNNLWNVCN